MTHAIRSSSLITITYSLNRNGQAARSTRATAGRRRYIENPCREADVAMASRHCTTWPIITPASRRGCAACCFRGLRAAKAFRVPRRRAFVSRGLPGTEGWNGAAAFDEGRGTVRPNGGQWTASSTFRSKRRRAIPAAEPPGRPRGSWSREALFHWELATLALATFPHWQHSFHAPSFLGADARPRTRGSSDARLRRLIRRANAVA